MKYNVFCGSLNIYAEVWGKIPPLPSLLTALIICAVFYRHGDMLYMKENDAGTIDAVKVTGPTAEDEIDKQLRKKDGKIYREKDPQL